MVKRRVWGGSCLAAVRVDRDFVPLFPGGYEGLLAYWRVQGIHKRYLNAERPLAFNCSMVGEDLLSSNLARREEAQLAMMALYLYPVATTIRRRWHIPDDAEGREKSWDEVQEAAKVIDQALEALRNANSEYDPAKSDVCHYLLLPRIGWGRSALARQKLGRKQDDRITADWRDHPYCGQVNCAICRARQVSVESYVGDVDDEAGDAKSGGGRPRIERARLPGDVPAFTDPDLWQGEPYWWHLVRSGLCSSDQAHMMDLRLIQELRHDDIATRQKKPVAAIRKAADRMLEVMELESSKCLLSGLVALLFLNRGLDFSEHHPFVDEMAQRSLRSLTTRFDVIEPVTRWIAFGRQDGSFRPQPSLIELACIMPGPVLGVGVWRDDWSESRSLGPVYHRFQKGVCSGEHQNFMLVGGTLARWLAVILKSMTIEVRHDAPDWYPGQVREKLIRRPLWDGIRRLQLRVQSDEGHWKQDGAEMYWEHAEVANFDVGWLCTPECWHGIALSAPSEAASSNGLGMRVGRHSVYRLWSVLPVDPCVTHEAKSGKYRYDEYDAMGDTWALKSGITISESDGV